MQPILIDTVKARLRRLAAHLADQDGVKLGNEELALCAERALRFAVLINPDADPSYAPVLLSEQEKQNQLDLQFVEANFKGFLGTVREWFDLLDQFAACLGFDGRYEIHEGMNDPEHETSCLGLFVDLQIGNLGLACDARQVSDLLASLYEPMRQRYGEEAAERTRALSCAFSIAAVSDRNLHVVFKGSPTPLKHDDGYFPEETS